MSTYNKWLTPYQRSYQQIKEKLIDGLSNLKGPNGKQLITDFSEGNILIIILSMFAAIAEVLHFYIDNMAREVFLPTARKYDSVKRQGLLVDYHAKAAIAATVDVTLARSMSNGISKGQVISISQGTAFSDSAGNQWLVAKDVVWNTNVSTCKVPLIQHSPYTIKSLLYTPIPSGDNIEISIGTLQDGLYEHGSMALQLGGSTWKLVDTFAYSKPTDKHFMVYVTNDDIPVIIFGDGTFGAKPAAGTLITGISCYTTKGVDGNVAAGSIVDVPSAISSSVSDATCSNINAAAGGSNYESFEQLKEHIPLSVKTLGVAVTKQDFIDYAKQIPGVNKAKLEYHCGRKMTLYISPDNGTVASSTLCTQVYHHVRKVAPLTTWLKVKSAGKALIVLQMDVTGYKSYKKNEIQSQVLQALYDKYSPEASDIGASVRLSDIYALIDNLSMVDYLHITKFYIQPWPTTIIGSKELEFSTFTLTKATGITKYYVYFKTATTYTLRSTTNGFVQDDIPITATTIDDTKNGNNFSLSFVDNQYTQGSKYEFTISEPNMDYNDPGYNIPVFEKASQLSLVVNETV